MSTDAQTGPPLELAQLVKQIGRDVGFDRVGIAAAEPLGRGQFLRDWLAAGHAGQMRYLANHLDKRNDPRRLLDGARNVICLAADYPHVAHPPSAVTRVARYAAGPDYHVALKRKGHLLVERLRREVGRAFESKVCVDTAPLLERELAARAGLGWIGKNTMLVHRRAGSCCLLAEIITTLDIAPDQPVPNHCGRCRRCMDACPTGAIVRPGVLDASRCISYLTIELRDTIPLGLRDKMGGQLFGCDRCQAVCPFNGSCHGRYGRTSPPLPPTPRTNGDGQLAGGAALDPRVVARWGEADYRDATAGTAADRATRSMWRRNAVVAIGNAGSAADTPLLRELANDPDPLVAEHARWAVERIEATRGPTAPFHPV